MSGMWGGASIPCCEPLMLEFEVRTNLKLAKFQHISNTSHLKGGSLHLFFLILQFLSHVFRFKAVKWCLAIVLKLFESKHVKNTNF